MGFPEGPLHQAPYNTPQGVASNPRSLVQVAKQAHPLVQIVYNPQSDIVPCFCCGIPT